VTGGPTLALSGSNLTGDLPFSCALAIDGAVHSAPGPTPDAAGRTDLARLAADLCRAHGTAPDRLAELRLDLGPGSYTGLRVAVTFVRFLQRFGDVRVLATDSFQLLAAAAAPPDATVVKVVFDARRGRFHVAELHRGTAGRWQHGREPASATAAELAAAPAGIWLLNAAVAAQVGAALTRAGGTPILAQAVGAAQLFHADLQLAPCADAALTPRYLTGSYADY
jgi:tRNA threonylcarbamoyladenosine biosynthesis protein TsaB